MYKASFSYTIIISFAIVRLFQESTDTDSNGVDRSFKWREYEGFKSKKTVDRSFKWSEYEGFESKKTNLTLHSYNDYVELDYTSIEPRPNATNEFEQKLLDAEIVDDVMTSFPETCLNVTFKHGDLIPGQRLSLLEAWEQPTITYEAEPRQFHTLLLNCNSRYFPFSSESRPEILLAQTGSEIAKWLVINIPGNNISAGRSLFNYTPPSRQHFKQVVDRYIFLLYKQKLKIRDHWLPDPINGEFYRPGEVLNDTCSFAEYYRLGNPIAVNFFLMHW